MKCHQTIMFPLHIIPKAKGRPRFFRMGKRVATYTPAKTRNYEENILAQAIQFKPQRPINGPIEVRLTFYMPAPKMPKKYNPLIEREILPVAKRPDLDNLAKAILDALNGVFWEDDKLIYKQVLKKVYSKNPRVWVEIREDGENEI